MSFIEVYGLTEVTRGLRAMREDASQNIDQDLDDAANYFIQRAQHYVPVDTGKLQLSIKKGSEVEAGSGLNLMGSHSLAVGVDLSAPGARTKSGTVREYAGPMERRDHYIAKAFMDTELYLHSKMQARINDLTNGFYARTAKRIRDTLRTIGQMIGGFFGGGGFR